MADITISDRSGSVRIRHGKGLKAREVPLNATARRALKPFLEGRPTPPKKTDAPLFVSSRETAMPVRTIQAVIASLARRARLKRVAVSAHTLRHTFALGYLRDNPGKLVELASLLGHDLLDTTAVYSDPRVTISRPAWSVRTSMSTDDRSAATTQARRRMAVPADPSEDELARHWSLTPADLAVIAECRGADHHRRFALQLCMLRAHGLLPR